MAGEMASIGCEISGDMPAENYSGFEKAIREHAQFKTARDADIAIPG